MGNLPHIETRTHRVDKFPSVVSTASSSSKVGITRIQLTLKAKTPPDPMGPTGTEMINSLLADDWNRGSRGPGMGARGGGGESHALTDSVSVIVRRRRGIVWRWEGSCSVTAARRRPCGSAGQCALTGAPAAGLRNATWARSSGPGVSVMTGRGRGFQK